MIRSRIFLLLSWVLVAGSNCAPQDDPGPDGGGTPAAASISGAVQKGPFILGSSIALFELGDNLQQTGRQFNASTANDLGEFSVGLNQVTPFQIEGTGFYFNEATETLSQGSLTLRSVFIPTSGENIANVNVISHLTVLRITNLVEAGLPFDASAAQAEAELRSELAICPPSIVLQRRSTALRLDSGDNDDNAYLLAVSAILARVALDRNPSAPDAELQLLLNSISLDLEDDGALETSVKEQIKSALLVLDARRVMAVLQERLQQVGSNAEVPNIQRVIDQDGDGFTNADDNCRFISSLDLTDSDNDGFGDRCDLPESPCQADDDCSDAMRCRSKLDVIHYDLPNQDDSAFKICVESCDPYGNSCSIGFGCYQSLADGCGGLCMRLSTKCSNGLKDPDEGDVDCGTDANCPGCLAGQSCDSIGDCVGALPCGGLLECRDDLTCEPI